MFVSKNAPLEQVAEFVQQTIEFINLRNRKNLNEKSFV